MILRNHTFMERFTMSHDVDVQRRGAQSAHRRPSDVAGQIRRDAILPTGPRLRAENRHATALREARLDFIEAAKARLWRRDLRLAELVNFLLVSTTVAFLLWQRWPPWAVAAGAAFTVAGMWTFARWSAPREERLRRLMVLLARHRRPCMHCGYQLRDSRAGRCPECGAAFDPDDTRHLFGPELLHLISARGRQVSAVVIVFVLAWVAAMARAAGWHVHVNLCGGLLAAFFLLHLHWTRAARRRSPTHPPLTTPRCPACAAPLMTGRPAATFFRPFRAPARTALPAACPMCPRRLTCGDLFIRPDARRLDDRRVLANQLNALLLRWFFLIAICTGLRALVSVDNALLRKITLGLGNNISLLALAVPVLLWVIGMGLVFRTLIRRSHRRLRMLFAQIGPACRGCNADLSSTTVGRPCPTCGRQVYLTDLIG